MANTISTKDTKSVPKNTPAKGVHVLFKLPNKKSNYWGVITQVNKGLSGTSYVVTRLGNGDSFTIQAKQVVRCARPGEQLTITHG